ncbi:MAG: LysM peptidoglycan-binding domain-containing protein, partial [Candidatus Desantisbacteria bacterium]
MYKYILLIGFFIIMQQGISEAKIIPMELVEGRDYKIITIVKGDTLWQLSKKYYNNPHMWINFRSYNDFTDPHWIYPGERLIISFVEVEKVVKFLKEQRDGVKKQKDDEEERLKQLSLQQQELEKRLKDEEERKLQDKNQQKDMNKLQAEIEGLKMSNNTMAFEHNQKTEELAEQLNSMKQEGELLRLSIAELERRLDTGSSGKLHGNGISGLSEKQ